MNAQALDHLFTAHHADDQLETLLMRLNRGAGVAGLAGVRSRRGAVVRPLLGWRKAELEALVQACGLKSAWDPSNSDDRYDRARLRKALATTDWLDPLAAAKSAAALEQAEAALQWSAQKLAAERLTHRDGAATLDPEGVPRELARRLLLSALTHINPEAKPRGDEVERLIDVLGLGQTATLAGVKCRGGALWQFEPAPPHRAGR
jgi:tRNA(Ile)-lysidine synthase